MSLSLSFLILLGAAAAGPPGASMLPPDFTGGLLPAGFLSARGSQIVGPDGAAVRIASVGLTGMNVVGGRLQLAGPFKGLDGHVAAMRALGFNCVRIRHGSTGHSMMPVQWRNSTHSSPPARRSD
jgi:hypothetical protein